ncbi:DUF4334 domain-containing protein [Cyanobium sp. ATX 6F1]|uniref:DUF4334 domain-containing protein n=1 Tax=unclassified Cyanobium TaxID=2627006 RepID=UPI0020CEB46C|nr:DUF4334 domain-containing protein [Cyanobium sp. ATX 6F1]MCP9917788.1 DUF4334 domain-containing protein [Cyanobium sp. ATX 6F1]
MTSPSQEPLPTARLLTGPLSTEAALELFDRLEPVAEESLIGAWRGSSYATGHPFDGLLENCHWHGKRFESSEVVHPLVFRRAGGQLISLEPRLLMPGLGALERMPWLGAPWVGRLFQALMPLLATGQSRARLRLTRYRGVESATMLYDHAPINDVFRRIDDDTLLGLMDLKGQERPFFFLLRRES